MAKDYHKPELCPECGYRNLRTSGIWSLYLTKVVLCVNYGGKFNYQAVKLSRNDTDTFREPPNQFEELVYRGFDFLMAGINASYVLAGMCRAKATAEAAFEERS